MNLLTLSRSKTRASTRAALIALAGLGLCGAALGGCAPLRQTNGYQAIDHKPADMKVGVDTKSTVLDALGSPSAVSTFDPNVWYYISQNSNQIGYHMSHVTKRTVVAITFNKESEMVTAVNDYALKDGKVIAYNTRETPTRGRELSVVEQLLGNVGRGGLLPQQDPTPGQRPGQ
jgi:outer membrane protein assembly factor BamE (lipoprotein component of BamABCDE complex)